MIVCPQCSKENQDHYKFCLGCGAELPKDAPKQFQAEKPTAAPAPVEEPTAKPVAMPAAPVEEPPAAAPCPQCGHMNEVGNRFCAACGYKLGLPAAPAKKSPSAAPAALPPSGVVLMQQKQIGCEVSEAS